MYNSQLMVYVPKKQAKNIDEEIDNLMKMSDKIAFKKEMKGLSKQDTKKDRQFIKSKISSGTFKMSQSNPKKPGSQAHKRYAKYSKTKNYKDYIKAGGTPSSMLFDYQHGYLKFN